MRGLDLVFVVFVFDVVFEGPRLCPQTHGGMEHRSAMQRMRCPHSLASNSGQRTGTARCLLAVLLLLARWPSPPVSATVRCLKPRWPSAAHRCRRPAAPTLRLRGGDQSDEHTVPEQSAPNRELLRLHSEHKGGRAAGMQRAEGSGTGAQTEMAEDYLRQLPAGLNDWRFGLAAGSEKHKFVVRSAFRQKHSFAERAEMAARIAASGKGVPVIAERLHAGIKLPDTIKPKFSVPASLTLDKFADILSAKLPWTDLYNRYSHIRLFVKQGAEMAVAANIGELHLLHKDPDGFLYLSFADSWRPDLGKGEEAAAALTPQELDRMLENRAQIFQDDANDGADGTKVLPHIVCVCFARAHACASFRPTVECPGLRVRAFARLLG